MPGSLFDSLWSKRHLDENFHGKPMLVLYFFQGMPERVPSKVQVITPTCQRAVSPYRMDPRSKPCRSANNSMDISQFGAVVSILYLISHLSHVPSHIDFILPSCVLYLSIPSASVLELALLDRLLPSFPLGLSRPRTVHTSS